MRTAEEILKSVALNYGYTSWGAATYDLSDKEIIEMTLEAMEEYANQFKTKLVIDKTTPKVYDDNEEHF